MHLRAFNSNLASHCLRCILAICVGGGKTDKLVKRRSFARRWGCRRGTTRLDTKGLELLGWCPLALCLRAASGEKGHLGKSSSKPKHQVSPEEKK